MPPRGDDERCAALVRRFGLAPFPHPMYPTGNNAALLGGHLSSGLLICNVLAEKERILAEVDFGHCHTWRIGLV